MKATITALLAVAAAACLHGCGPKEVRLESDTDSLSYAIGVNLGVNLLRMDSTLNVDAVAQAVRDVWNGRERMNLEEARTYFLAQKTFFVYERARRYEEKLLADIAAGDKEYVRNKNGVTYKITELGDQSIQSMNSRDTVTMFYSILDEAGEVILSHDSMRVAYREMVEGLQDIVRATGDGGKFEAWVPYDLAYGAEGNEEKGIRPYQTLHFSVDSLVIKYNNPGSRK